MITRSRRGGEWEVKGVGRESAGGKHVVKKNEFSIFFSKKQYIIACFHVNSETMNDEK